MEQKIKLGQRVRDIVTHYEGIAVAHVEYLNGCIQYGVKPLAKDGNMPEVEYIDYQQLEVIDDGVSIKPAGDIGGVMSDAPKK